MGDRIEYEEIVEAQDTEVSLLWIIRVRDSGGFLNQLSLEFMKFISGIAAYIPHDAKFFYTRASAFNGVHTLSMLVRGPNKYFSVAISYGGVALRWSTAESVGRYAPAFVSDIEDGFFLKTGNALAEFSPEGDEYE